MIKQAFAVAFGLGFAAAALAAGGTAQVDGARIINADSEPGNWLTTARSYSEQRFSPLKRINDGNVAQLGLAWTYRLDVDRGVEATPVVVDGVMYTTGAYSIVYALDAASGALKWKFDPLVPRDTDRDGCCDVGNRGVAVWKGRVYVAAFDGRLFALDAATGRKVWVRDTVIDHKRSYTITGAPRIVKGRVIIGNGGAEFGVRGYVTAYDAASGKQAWRIFLVPGDPSKPPENKMMAMARPTWSGSYWSTGGGGGGTAWDSMAYDPDLDLLYIGTGNGSSWNRKVRSDGHGDNLFLSSILAVKPETGAYVWHYQTTPGDTWDYTATQSIILAELTINGKSRKVLMQAPKNSFFYVLDRATGELLSAQPYLPTTWASGVDMSTGRPQENAGADWTTGPKLVVPGPLGAHNWQPMSYSPLTGLVYIPAQENAGLYSPANDSTWQHRGVWNIGTQPLSLPEDVKQLQGVISSFKGHLLAWDPVLQKARWTVDYPNIWNGGTLATAGNLVFQGTADGRVVAYAADTGSKLWESPANTGVMAGPMSYEVGGEQYVTFMAGWGGAFPLALGGIAQNAKVMSEARVITFKLGGSATLPPPEHKLAPLPPPPALTADAATVDRGRNLFNGICGVCHGLNAIGGGVLPDLRYLTSEKHLLFNGIVAGAYARKGMPSFSDLLKPDDVDAVHQYLIQRAHDLDAQIKAESTASAH